MQGLIARGISIGLVVLMCMPAAADRRRPVRRDAWNAQLIAARISSGVFAGRVIDASSRLSVSWNAAPGAIDHYRLTATDVLGGVPLTIDAASTATSLDLSGLTSSTTWSVSIDACRDSQCLTRIPGGDAPLVSTDVETWQIRGTGRGFASSEKLVSDGNTKAFPLLRGVGAGAGLEGTAQLYYDPNVAGEKGIKIGTLSGPITDSPDSVSHFEPLSGYGFLRTGISTPDSIGPATHHPVALARGSVRMFWETSLEDGKGRVLSRDSVDGWQGRDFHPGTPTICSTDDVRPGGPCEPELVIGTEADDPARWTKIANARQLKLVLPTLDDWRWDESPGTPMLVTLHFAAGICSATKFNAGYAVYDGSRWNVQYGDDGCPKLIPGVQAPMPVHMGGGRWKVVFNNNLSGEGPLVATKPLRILYADARATGDPEALEFEDWETIDRAREVRVLWPDGTELSVDDESRFDDFAIWMPTGDPELQVLYTNMSCNGPGCGVFVGTAVLVNP